MSRIVLWLRWWVLKIVVCISVVLIFLFLWVVLMVSGLSSSVGSGVLFGVMLVCMFYRCMVLMIWLMWLCVMKVRFLVGSWLWCSVLDDFLWWFGFMVVFSRCLWVMILLVVFGLMVNLGVFCVWRMLRIRVIVVFWILILFNVVWIFWVNVVFCKGL